MTWGYEDWVDKDREAKEQAKKQAKEQAKEAKKQAKVPKAPKVPKVEQNLIEIQKCHDDHLKDSTDYEKFILYLAENAHIRVQAPDHTKEQLKIEYFNDTGEELPDEEIHDLSPETFGSAMVITFPMPKGDKMSQPFELVKAELTLEELEELLPDMPKLRHSPHSDDDNSHPEYNKETKEVTISNMRYVRCLLKMGFRVGTKHNKELVEENLK